MESNTAKVLVAPEKLGSAELITDISLIPKHSKQFRLHGAKAKDRRIKKLGQRPDRLTGFCPPSDEFAKLAEQSVRAWLRLHFTLGPNQVLSYRLKSSKGKYRQCYRELDAVSLAGKPPQFAFEIKAGSGERRIAVARSHLCEIQEIMRLKWPQVRMCALIVDTRFLDESEWDSGCLFDTLQTDLLQLSDPGDASPLIISLNPKDVWNFAIQYHALLRYLLS